MVAMTRNGVYRVRGFWLSHLLFFIKVFAGNADQDSVVYHDLNPPITSQYILFVPVDYHLHVSMRVELYGCLQGNEE